MKQKIDNDKKIESIEQLSEHKLVEAVANEPVEQKPKFKVGDLIKPFIFQNHYGTHQRRIIEIRDGYYFTSIYNEKLSIDDVDSCFGLIEKNEEPELSHSEEKAKHYDGYMDEECISLCDKLNSLSSIETTESCCGHCRSPYMIFFNCYDFVRLGKLFRCVNRNYSDGKWRIELSGSDTCPCYEFMLISKEPFNSTEEMMKSVNDLIENIDYWENPIFNNYFNNNGK